MEERNPSPNKELNRSHAHPVVTISDGVEFVKKIHSDLGYTSYHDKNAIAKVYGLAYDTIKQRLSTCSQYGLLELRHGTGYKVTPLFLKIYRPENDHEKREGYIEALRTPDLYSKLIAEYDGHNLPSQVGLSTTLFRRYGLNEKAAERAAEVFLENLRYLNLINSENVLNFGSSNSPKSDVLETVDVYPANNGQEMKMLQYVELVDTSYLEIPIPLKDGRKAFVKVPENAVSEDYVRIAKVIEAYQ